jgi:hypothetical protein
MKDTGRFITWLMGQTRLMRYFFIALLFHVLILLVLGSVKIVAILPKIVASFDGAPLPPAKEAEPDPLAAYRDFEYKGPTLGGGGGTPGKGAGGVPTAAGKTPPEYNANITAPDKIADSQVTEVIGVVSESATAVARLQSRGDLSAPIAGLGENRTDIAGPGGGGFGQRLGPMRAQSLAKYSGSAETEKAVLAGLRWLKNNQQPNGSWPCHQSVAAGTALAALAFLGHGEMPDSEEFGPTVNKALRYLVATVGTDGVVTESDRSANMYAQGIVMLALSEAYGMTQSPRLKEPLERAVKAIVASQKAPKKDPRDIGGWRYSINADDSDSSVSGWIIMGLKSARLAGVAVSDETFELASQYLWTLYGDGTFGYNSPRKTPGTTAIGVLCQQFMGHGEDRRIKQALDFLKEQKADWAGTKGDFVLYGWYYQTQAMFHGGGAYWEYWNRQIRDTMIKNQQDDGRWLSPPNSESEQKDMAMSPVYSTALGCLILEVYYRYLPIYQELDKKTLPAP